LPLAWETGKIYIITSWININKSYRWSWSQWVDLNFYGKWWFITWNVLDQPDIHWMYINIAELNWITQSTQTTVGNHENTLSLQQNEINKLKSVVTKTDSSVIYWTDFRLSRTPLKRGVYWVFVEWLRYSEWWKLIWKNIVFKQKLKTNSWTSVSVVYPCVV
jgi:hypothetical protein